MIVTNFFFFLLNKYILLEGKSLTVSKDITIFVTVKFAVCEFKICTCRYIYIFICERQDFLVWNGCSSLTLVDGGQHTLSGQKKINKKTVMQLRHTRRKIFFSFISEDLLPSRLIWCFILKFFCYSIRPEKMN